MRARANSDGTSRRPSFGDNSACVFVENQARNPQLEEKLRESTRRTAGEMFAREEGWSDTDNYSLGYQDLGQKSFQHGRARASLAAQGLGMPSVFDTAYCVELCMPLYL